MVTSTVITGSVLDTVVPINASNNTNGTTVVEYTVPADRFAIVHMYTVSQTGTADISFFDGADVSSATIVNASFSGGSGLFWSLPGSVANQSNGVQDLVLDEGSTIKTNVAAPASSCSIKAVAFEYIK